MTQIEWRKSGLYGLSGSSLYKSTNSGKTWAKQSTFKGAPGLLSASDELMLVTVGSDIYTSKNEVRVLGKFPNLGNFFCLTGAGMVNSIGTTF